MKPYPLRSWQLPLRGCRKPLRGARTIPARSSEQIPKFRFSSAMNLNEMLQAAGIDSAFGGDADFSEITDYDIWISGITQRKPVSASMKRV